MPADTRSYSTDEVSLQNYRSVSLLAVGGLLLGISSWLAILHPVLWPVAWFAVVVSWLAWRATQAPDSRLTGGWMAAMGLSLGILFSTWPPASLVTKNAILSRQADMAVQAFFSLVREGDLLAAHQWALAPPARLSNAVTREKQYATNEDLQAAKDRFFDTRELNKWTSFTDGARLKWIKRLQSSTGGNTELVSLLYEWSARGQTAARLVVAARCDHDKTTDFHNWQVDGVTTYK